MSFTDVFGGSTVQPADVSYSAVALSATIPTYFPAYVTGTQQPLARIMDVTASTTGLAVKLPDATLAGKGQDVFFNNPGSNSYAVQDSGGNVIATITAGQQRYIYLTDNSTSNGVWRSILFGVGASSPDASGLAGYGLKVIGATLNQGAPVSTISSNTTLVATDRAKVLVNTGGTITVTLPLAATATNDWFVEIRNQGTGILTVAAAGSDTVDASATMALQLNESCFIHSGGIASYYTVGRGRNTQFNFTQLAQSLAGLSGTYTLSLAQASNVVQTYSGALAGNIAVVLPAVVQVYYVANNTTGFSLTLQSPTPGTTLVLPSGQSAVVFCNGIDVINASTSISGITSLLLSAGTSANPSLAISAINNGFYAPTSTTLAASANGTEVTRWTSTQLQSLSGAVGSPTYSFTASPGTGAYRSGADIYSIATASTLRFSIDATGQIAPGADNTQGLGTGALRFSSIYGTNLFGILSGSLTTTTTINSNVVGYRDIPINTPAWTTTYVSGYTLLLGDAGFVIRHPNTDTTARLVIIPDNGTTAFPIGTTIVIVNQPAAGALSVYTASADILWLGGTITSGAGLANARSIATGGVATLIKIDTQLWVITGAGVT